MPAAVSAGDGGVDVEGLRELARAFRKADRTLYDKLRRRMKSAGQIVADNAKARTAYSTRIPGSIRVRTTSAVNVFVRAGGPGAGDAAPIENRGKGFVRHPLFGNRDRWYSNPQPAYLAPALTSSADAVAEEIARGVDDTMREAGL